MHPQGERLKSTMQSPERVTLFPGELNELHLTQARLAAIVESSDDAISKTLDGQIVSHPGQPTCYWSR